MLPSRRAYGAVLIKNGIPRAQSNSGEAVSESRASCHAATSAGDIDDSLSYVVTKELLADASRGFEDDERR